MKEPADQPAYRVSDSERLREESLLRLVDSGESAIDIGTREGHYSRLLRNKYHRVVALDLKRPHVEGCECVVGDVRNLQFPDCNFDLVFCAEVLEHVPNVELAAREIVRVCRGRAVIGVPYKQDTRLGRVTCGNCGRIGPPYGHINSFDERRLCSLFSGLKLEQFDYVGSVRSRTNRLSTWLLDLAGNPWGSYGMRQPCPHCGSRYQAPMNRTVAQKLVGRVGLEINELQKHFTKPYPNWIHAVFTR